MRAFHDSFERSADISHGRIVKAGNWNSRLGMADRAYGMSPVDGVKAPDAVASPGAPAIPEVLAERARRKAEADRAAAEDRTRAKAGGGQRAGMHVGTVHVHVAAHPYHDERQVAEMVHKRFNDAVHAQLNDGAYG